MAGTACQTRLARLCVRLVVFLAHRDKGARRAIGRNRQRLGDTEREQGFGKDFRCAAARHQNADSRRRCAGRSSDSRPPSVGSSAGGSANAGGRSDGCGIAAFRSASRILDELRFHRPILAVRKGHIRPRPEIICPRRATTKLFATKGCASVAVKTSSGRL